MPVLVLQHSAEMPPGYIAELGDWLFGGLEVVELHRGDPLPTTHEWPAIVSLGGLIDVSAEGAHPWIRREKRLLAAAVLAGVSVLGIGLGCQLLATALGGRVRRGESGPELGTVDTIELTDECRYGSEENRTIERLYEAQPVPVWHRDTFDVPPGATLLARSSRYPHAFRLGPALGIQAHPEATPEIVDQWIESRVGRRLLAAEGIPGETVRREVAACKPSSCSRVFVAWSEKVAQRRTR